ncbi:uncharacterized protein RAG0_05651 [Rhynchosporium agropyri]|uniref:Tyrosinase copper-binding domain-containing protein n=1 Tax=Rhynchosporium agropyri TaxID=914238 RepID=A0A1E1KDY0_9HELO|nr:uncharacterized protein RAG0_05651 [Rhynchosporium agropyri]
MCLSSNRILERFVATKELSHTGIDQKMQAVSMHGLNPLFSTLNGAYIAKITGIFINASLEIPGRNTGGWVTAGLWANAMVLMGPGNSLSYTPHCIATHGGGRFNFGGAVEEMSEMYSSPVDPLFWVHHSMVHRMACPDNYFGHIPYKNITLKSPPVIGPLGAAVNIGQVMHTSCAPLGAYSYA